MATRILTALFAGAAALAVAAPAMAQFIQQAPGQPIVPGSPYLPQAPVYSPPPVYRVPPPLPYAPLPQPQPVIIAPTGNGQFLLRPY